MTCPICASSGAILRSSLGLVAFVGVLMSGCAPPLEPSPVTLSMTAATPTAISLKVSQATSANESVLSVRVTDATGAGLAGQMVTLTTTAGTFDQATITTGSNGTAQAMLTTTETAMITAQTSGLSDSVQAIAFSLSALPATK